MLMSSMMASTIRSQSASAATSVLYEMLASAAACCAAASSSVSLPFFTDLPSSLLRLVSIRPRPTSIAASDVSTATTP